jgi:hypothetical protein
MGAIDGSVSAATSGRTDIIPDSMDELARVYFGFILGMVRKAGIPDQDAEDSVQYILQQLGIAPSVIDQFNPEHVTEHQGRLVKTRFSTFLGRKVLLYCRGEGDRLRKRSGRELPIVDATTQDGTSLVDLIGATAVWDDYSRLDAADCIALMRSHLVAIPPRSDRDTCDLVALFDEMMAEVEQNGLYTYAGIQARFGISGTTAGSWLSRLRLHLSLALGRPPVTIGGVSLTYDEIAVALKILREAKGIMVAQPLAKAGHPLAKAAKGWYHPFSRDEIRKFPALAIGPGTHRKPAGHVKEAVMHRLERILAKAAVLASEVTVPEIPALSLPEPEPVTPEEEFECALWHGVRDAADLERVKALAKSVYAVSEL